MASKENKPVTVSSRKNRATIAISGNFDSEVTPKLQKICDSIGRNDAIKEIVIDFQDVTKVDSSAFACMINFMKEHVNKGKKLFAKNVSRLDNLFIKMLKIEKLITIIGSED